MKLKRKCQRGVTLMELVVTVIVVSILAGAGIPMYLQFSQDARRTDAQRLLSELVSRQEQFRLHNKTYTAALGAGGLNGDTQTEDGSYRLELVDPSDACPLVSCFELRAVPQGRQTEDDCGTLTYTSSGQKKPSTCWP